MRRLFKGRFAILGGLFIIVLLLTLLITVSVAWFYFPTTQNVTIFTDINYEIGVDLYEYKSNLGSFVQAGLNDDEDSVVANTSSPTTFVEWGGVFYPTLSFMNYYMLVLTYPDSNFLNGYLNADLNIELSAGMHEDDENNLVPNDKILYTKIAYAIAPNANLDPLVDSSQLIMQAQAASYTFLFNPPNIDPEAPLDFMDDDHLNISLLNLAPAQYTNVTPLNTQCRIILFIRIESDASHIAQSIAENEIAVDVVQITTANIYSFSCNFRSIPFKTDRIRFEQLNCMIDDRGLSNSFYIYAKKELQERLI